MKRIIIKYSIVWFLEKNTNERGMDKKKWFVCVLLAYKLVYGWNRISAIKIKFIFEIKSAWFFIIFSFYPPYNLVSSHEKTLNVGFEWCILSMVNDVLIGLIKKSFLCFVFFFFPLWKYHIRLVDHKMHAANRFSWEIRDEPTIKSQFVSK